MISRSTARGVCAVNPTSIHLALSAGEFPEAAANLCLLRLRLLGTREPFEAWGQGRVGRPTMLRAGHVRQVALPLGYATRWRGGGLTDRRGYGSRVLLTSMAALCPHTDATLYGFCQGRSPVARYLISSQLL